MNAARSRRSLFYRLHALQRPTDMKDLFLKSGTEYLNQSPKLGVTSANFVCKRWRRGVLEGVKYNLPLL